jgi:hypothetical protein
MCFGNYFDLALNRYAERQKMPHDLLSLLQPRSCPVSKKSEDYLSVWGVDDRKI